MKNISKDWKMKNIWKNVSKIDWFSGSKMKCISGIYRQCLRVWDHIDHKHGLQRLSLDLVIWINL